MKCFAASALLFLLSAVHAQEEGQDEGARARRRASEARRRCVEALRGIEGVAGVNLAGVNSKYGFLIILTGAGAKEEARRRLGGDTFEEFKITWFVRAPAPSGGKTAGTVPSRSKRGSGSPDPAAVDAAVERGMKFLRAELKKAEGKSRVDGWVFSELMLLALARGGLGPGDPVFRAALGRMVRDDYVSAPCTYVVALQAMVLEAIDREQYRRRIYDCAQFLADHQGKDGSWNYGDVKLRLEKAPWPPARVAPDGREIPGSDAASKGRIVVRKTRFGRSGGDPSNSQYAALGLRACHDGGIVLPKSVLKKAASWWRARQCPNGGWGYRPHERMGTGSMTAGGIGSLVIYDHLLGVDVKKDTAVSAGIRWMGWHFRATANPIRKDQRFYYLYALERAGILAETRKFGARDWYVEGARFLLRTQKEDGSWVENRKGPVRSVYTRPPVTDTCFAILFLKRATRPMVPTLHIQPK